jgi:hypothetical protein
VITSTQIFETARKYVGLPFRHQGRSRPCSYSGTVDCAGLLVCVGEDLELFDKTGAPILRSDHMDIGPQPHQDFINHAIAARLIGRMSGEPPRPGDVVTLRAPNSISHCGIISSFPEGGRPLGLIFPYPVRLSHSTGGKIVEVGLDERWSGRIAGVFSYPGVQY